MWRLEPTENGEDLVWSQPELGIAPSALKGTANLQNVNIATQAGTAMAGFARTNQAQAAITGGTLTPDGATLFTAPSNLYSGAWIRVTASTVTSITAATNPTSLDIDYLIVGGGGGGGVANNGAGGGGGGGEALTGTDSLAVGSYEITVGDGGRGGTDLGNTQGDNGEDSAIETVATANGGGGGGAGYAGLSPSSLFNGLPGGNGGGGGGSSSGAGTGGTGDQFNGGNGNNSNPESGGGGGGSAEVGAVGTTIKGGDGGDGISSSISGTATNYGGGGGGGGDSPGLGGAGGGGFGGAPGITPEDGEANTGGGGGGGETTSATDDAGADGGSGIVIISYPTGSAYALGGAVSYAGGNTIHTFTEDGIFEVVSISTGGLYYVSYRDNAGKIKLSTAYDPYGTDVVTHGTTGTVTFDVLATPNQPIAKATERYYTASGKEYRYYLLDANSRIWVYDTQVYASTLAANSIGVTWMLPDPNDYTNEAIKGINILNGWLFMLSASKILCKPTVVLGQGALFMFGGYLTNPYATHPKYAYVGSQGTLLYTDGNYIGEIFPTNSLVTSIANLQSYASYTGTGSTGVVDVLIGGSNPSPINGSRLPVVFFTEEGGTLPTAVTANTVYFLDYNNVTNVFTVYTALTGGTTVNVETGAVGTQYFNTFYPVGNDAGADGDNPTLQFTSQRVNLPFYETAKRLVEIGNTILIGCESNIVYPWNQVDAVPSDVITLPESDVQTMINVNNTAYIFAGNKGNIYITNNVVASLRLKIPDYTAGVPGTSNSYIDPTFTWGDAEYVRGRVYCSILDQTSTKAGNCGGIWSFIPSENIDPMQEVGTALRLEAQNSYGNYSGYAPIIITDQEQIGISPKYWAAWQSSYSAGTSTFGIDYSLNTPVTTFVIETDLLPTGTFLNKKTFKQLEYKLAVPLAAGDSVQLYWRLNATSAWTSAGTVVSETADPISGYFIVNFEKTQWTQIRLVGTTGGTSASSFIPVEEIRLR